MEWYVGLGINITIEQEGRKTLGTIELILMYGDHPFVPPIGMNIDVPIMTDWDECLPVTGLIWSIRRGNLLIDVVNTSVTFTDLESFKELLEDLVGEGNIVDFTFLPNTGPLKEECQSVFKEVSKNFVRKIPW